MSSKRCASAYLFAMRREAAHLPAKPAAKPDFVQVTANTKNCGFDDDGLADGWYWFRQADFDAGMYDNAAPHAGMHGPFATREQAVKDAT